MGKLCECGCGNPTSLATKTNAARSTIKGQPNRFITNHHQKVIPVALKKGGKTVDADGYQMTLNKGHHRARGNGYVLDHVVAAELINGGPLPAGAVIHHLSDKSDNSKILICKNQSEHAHIHANERAFAACGNKDYRKCKFCHQWDDTANLVYAKSGRSHYHKKCHARYEMERRHGKRI